MSPLEGLFTFFGSSIIMSLTFGILYLASKLFVFVAEAAVGFQYGIPVIIAVILFMALLATLGAMGK